MYVWNLLIDYAYHYYYITIDHYIYLYIYLVTQSVTCSVSATCFYENQSEVVVLCIQQVDSYIKQ